MSERATIMSYLSIQDPVPPIRLPVDLRVWLGEDRLLRLALEAGAHHAAPGTAPRNLGHGDQSFPLAQLLALTGFCYVSGRFGSEEIEGQLESDDALRYLCAGRFPPSALLRHFRRVHRCAIVAALEAILRVAVGERTAHAWAASPVHGLAAGLCLRETGIARLCAQSAEARVSRAVFADAMALDV